LMLPRRLLLLRGTVLVAVELAGLRGLLARISTPRVFNPPNSINCVHFVLGVVVLIVATVANRRVQNAFTLMAAILGSTLGLAGLLLGPYLANRYAVRELADPSEHLPPRSQASAGPRSIRCS
jgi:hypothetical protein